MNPGRELDALVAEKIFRQQVVDIMGQVAIQHRITTPFEYIITPEGIKPTPPYSTDIAAAWEVVEKLKLSIVYNRDMGTWLAGILDAFVANQIVDGWMDVSATSKTAPHAICLSALQASGVKLEQL